MFDLKGKFCMSFDVFSEVCYKHHTNAASSFLKNEVCDSVESDHQQ